MTQVNTTHTELTKGTKVHILDADSTYWEYGYIVAINAKDALINYGSKTYPNYGMGGRVPLHSLKIVED